MSKEWRSYFSEIAEKKLHINAKSEDHVVVSQAFLPVLEESEIPMPLFLALQKCEQTLKDQIFPAAKGKYLSAREAGLSRAEFHPVSFMIDLYSCENADYSTWLITLQTRRKGELLRFSVFTVTGMTGTNDLLPLSCFLPACKQVSQCYFLQEEEIYLLENRFHTPNRCPHMLAADRYLEVTSKVPMHRHARELMMFHRRQQQKSNKNQKMHQKKLDKPGDSVYNTVN